MKTSAVFEKAETSVDRNTTYTASAKPGHIHDTNELFLLLEGRMTLVCNAERIDLSAPAAVLFNSYSIHNGIIPQDALCDRFVLTFRDEVLTCGSPLCREAGFFKGRGMTLVRLDENKKQLLLPLVARMAAYAGDTAAQEHLVLWILYELAGWYSAQEDEAARQKKEYIDRVVRYMAENCAEAITLESLAARFFVSRAKLVADFRQATGMTVKNYLALIRLCSAGALLSRGFSVAQTAALCGFADKSYFIACFSRYYGTTPGQYRQQRDKAKQN